MTEVIRVATLNTEGGSVGPHRDRIPHFLQTVAPHILALQEVFAPDPAWIQEQTHSRAAHFLPNFNVENPLSERIPGLGLFGIALVSALQPINVATHYFTSQAYPGTSFIREEEFPTSRGVLTATYAMGNRTLRISTTHFTWSPDGRNTQEQWEDWNRLSKILASEKPDVILGDFNVPRGTKLARTIARSYHSVLPPTVQTTMDHARHKDPRLPPRVVDYIFIPKTSQVTMVPGSLRVCSGVSDHCAIVCDIMYR